MSQQNRFAALSPEFKGEEKRRRKAAEEKARKDAAKVKKEEEAKKKAETRSETQGFAVSEGAKKTKLGSSAKDEPGAYEIAMKESKIPPKEHHFTGSADPVHPFDRKSGTGRGKEVPKQGGGKANWGKPEDDIKYPLEEEEEKETESPVAEKEPEKGKGKKEKKGKKTVEKKEEELDPNGNALTYGEYKEIQAEKQKEGGAKKPKIVYEKKKVPAETAPVQYQPKATAPVEEEKHVEVKAPAPQAPVVEKPKEEPKKIVRPVFVMKEDDFPSLK